ncbi:hypothetical protein [Methylophaga sp.]|jgi:hypothetical protein|uniref:hypothetical protein n=1 Tax=Methylophaga sp. TaxID=2024840 RepID=UPI003A915D84
MQYSYSQYTDIQDAKTKITSDINSYANLSIDAKRFFTNITLAEQLERYKQALDYIEFEPPTNEKHRLVEAAAIARGISMLSAAVSIYINDEDFFDVLWSSIEEIRARHLDNLEALELPDTINDAVAIRMSALEELLSL